MMRSHLPRLFFLRLLQRLCLLGFCLVFWTSTSPGWAQTETPLQQGIQALDGNRLEEALTLFRQAVSEAPGAPEPHVYLGMTLQRMGRLPEAEAAFLKGLELDPRNVEVKLLLAILYDDMGRLPEARKTYQDVAETAAKEVVRQVALKRLTRLEIRIHFAEARELTQEKKFQEGFGEFEQVLRLDPQNGEAYFGMGEIELLLEKNEEALAAYQKALDFHFPNPAAVYLRLGQIYEAEQAWEKAREVYEKAVEQKKEGPEGTEAAKRLERIQRQVKIQGLIKEIYNHIDKSEKEAALQGVEALLALDPNNAMAFYFRGYVEDAQGHYPEAVADLSRAMELAPSYLTAAVKLGIVYSSRLGETDKARSLFRDVVTRGKPDDEAVKKAKEWLGHIESGQMTQATLAEAKTALQQGEVAGGIEALEEAVRLRPKLVDSYLLLAALYTKAGQDEKALEILKKAVEAVPKSAKAHLQLGILLQRRGELEGARLEFDRVVSLAKGSEEAVAAEEQTRLLEAIRHFQEAQKLATQGDYEAALREVRQVVSDFPDNASAWVSQGVIYDRLQKPEEAISSFRKAIELQPDYIQARRGLIQTLEDQGRFDEARSEYNAILSVTKDEKTVAMAQSGLQNLDQVAQLYTYTRSARELYKQGRYQESLAETEKLLALRPANFLAHLLRGLNMVALKQPVEAIGSFRKALEIQPKSLQARLYLGEAYRDESRFEEAIEAFKQVVREGEGTREGDMAAQMLRRLRPVTYSLSYSQSANSNITQSASPQTSVSSGLNAGLSYILLRAKNGELSVRGSAQQSIYYASQSMGFSWSGSLSGQYRLGDRWAMSGSLDPVNYNYLDRIKTSSTRATSLSVSGGGGRIPTRVAFQGALTEAHSFRSPSGNARVYTFSASGLQQFSAKDSVNITYTVSSNANLDPRGSNFAYRSNQLSTDYSREIRKDVLGRLGVSMTVFNYTNPDSTKLFRQFRRTYQYTLTAGLSFPLSEWVGFGVSYAYTQSKTNLTLSEKEQLTLEDILASPIPTVGGDFQRQSLSINLSVSF